MVVFCLPYRIYPISAGSASMRALSAITGPLPTLFVGRKLIQREAPPGLFGFQPLLGGWGHTRSRLAGRSGGDWAMTSDPQLMTTWST